MPDLTVFGLCYRMLDSKLQNRNRQVALNSCTV